MSRLLAELRLARRDFTLDVRLDQPARGVTALFGQSGSGKTTVLRCLAGLERAQGHVQLGDSVWQDARRFVPTHRRALGVVFQEASLFPHLSVAANLDYGARRRAGAGKVDRAHLLALLGIGHLLARKPDTLSGGERQRVAIARALFAAPELLLMDEPLAALDDARRAEILPYLDALHAELDIPVVYVTHSVAEVARLADHVVVLDAGRVRWAGNAREGLARLGAPATPGASVLSAIVLTTDPDGCTVELAGQCVRLPGIAAHTGETLHLDITR